MGMFGLKTGFGWDATWVMKSMTHMNDITMVMMIWACLVSLSRHNGQSIADRRINRIDT